MGTVALVIVDAARAYQARVTMLAQAYQRAGFSAAEADATARGQEREPIVGDLWTTADLDCPRGLPNCRHCGDPAHTASCVAAGHCPDCGTKHAVAPDAVLAKHGLEIHLLDAPPAAGMIWDRDRRAFVAAPPSEA